MLHTKMTPLLSMRGWRHALLMFVCGGFSALAFAPFHAWPLLVIGLSTLFLSLYVCQNKWQALRRGWSWGFGFFIVGMYWICVSMLTDVERFAWMIPFCLLGLNGGLALFFGLAAMIFSALKRPHSLHYNLLIFTLCIFAAEMARSLVFTGLPWNLMGYSWGAHDVSVQIVSVTGIYILTLFTIFMASAPALLLSHVPMRVLPSIVAALLLAGALIFGVQRLETAEHSESDVRLRLVQASIPQHLKWNQSFRPQELQVHKALSLAEGYEDIDVFIWPETAYPYSISKAEQSIAGVDGLLNDSQMLITGAVTVEQGYQPPKLYNSLVVAKGADAAIREIYDKQHLVPFGEFVPLRNVLPVTKITSGSVDFSSGNEQSLVDSAGLPAFVPLICYEAIFPAYSNTQNQAKWLLNISNDGWFGLTSGPYQHLQAARFRAIEQGAPMIRSANNGISAVFDGYGRMIASLGLNEEAILDVNLPNSLTKKTIYSSIAW